MSRPRLHATNAARQRAYRRRLKRNARALRNEWFTPPDVLELVRQMLGGIDLDPASCAAAQEVVQASAWFDKDHDGLKQPWHGRVWLNPPYSSPEVGLFTAKLAEEYDAGRTTAAIAVVNNSTDTSWFRALFRRFPACFAGRIRFWRADRTATQPRIGQVFFYLGPDFDLFDRVFSAVGEVRPPRCLERSGEEQPCA